MRKLLFSMAVLIFGAAFLVSCNQEDDVTPQVTLEEGQVSLSMVNVLSNTRPINGRLTNYNPADPFCSPETEIVVSNIAPDQRRITFVGKIVDDKNQLIGYKFRARNGVGTAINNVEVRVGTNVIWSTPSIPAFTEVFFITPNPVAGVSMFWDGGQVGTASTNETVVRTACVSDQCAFANFTHNAPSVFDVYFVPTAGGQTVVRTGVSSTTPLVVTLPLVEYTVYVTNFSDGSTEPYKNLPDFASQIFMVGSQVIDYGKVKNGTVIVNNPYAAVMVANNNQLKGVPALSGNPLTLATGGQYFLIYTKASTPLTLAITDVRDMSQDQTLTSIVANQQYRFLLCLESTLDIKVNSVFDGLPNNTIIRGH